MTMKRFKLNCLTQNTIVISTAFYITRIISMSDFLQRTSQSVVAFLSVRCKCSLRRSANVTSNTGASNQVALVYVASDENLCYLGKSTTGQ